MLPGRPFPFTQLWWGNGRFCWEDGRFPAREYGGGTAVFFHAIVVGERPFLLVDGRFPSRECGGTAVSIG